MATYDLTKTIPAAEDLLAGDILNCTYTGSEISITLAAGRYKIEAYGAAGATNTRNTNYKGGEGGHSYGTISFDDDMMIYLNAGGTGGAGGSSSATKNAEGYNGGGYSYYYAGSGGGATHVATSSGLLSTLSNNTGSIIIVAGGGGGSSAYSTSTSSTSYRGAGGKGGGEEGEHGYYGTSNSNSNALKYGGSGGTQTAGGKPGTATSRVGTAGSFGQGGNGGSASSSYYGEGGGGGGYYGGGGASSYEAGGGGGSGYLSASLTDSLTEQGGNTGNGYITITILEIYSRPHTITFYDGTNVIGTVETEGKETITLPTAPSKDGYRFLGYYLADGTTQITETSYATAKLTEDVACFAKYRKYNIEFYVDGALLSTISTTGKETITFPEATKEGYQFSLWQLADGTTLNQEYLDNNYLTSDLQAQAIFIKKYAVSFICDGTAYKEYESIGYEEIAIPDAIPSKDGYTFEGWFLDSSYQVSYTADYFKNIPIEKDYTIYGKLTEDVPDEPTYKSNVNFYVQDFLYHTIATKGKETLTFPANPSLYEHSFDGWYSDRSYSVSFTATSLENRWINKDLNVYAKFTELPKYDVNFIINGHRYYSYKSCGKETLKTLPNPTIPNYAFEGWYFDEDYSVPFDANKYLDEYLTEDVNIYAKTSYAKKNVIYFYTSISATTPYATITTTGKETLELPNEPEAELGYEFDNWYLDKKFNNVFDLAYYETHWLTDNINVYANFKASSTGPYSLTVSKDGEGNIIPDVGTHSIAKGTTTTITITPTTLPFRYLEIDGEAVEVTEAETITPSSACAYFDFNADATDVLGRSTTSTSGTPAISTDQIKFGTGSIYFSGTAALLIALPDSFDDKFTVEFWFYTSNSAKSGVYPTMFSTNTDNAYGGVYCAVDDGAYGDSMICRANAASSSGNNGATGSECDKSVWNHFCYCRSGNNNYYFLNGTLMATVTQSNPITVNTVCLGGLMRSTSTSGMLSSDYYTGYIDDLLISNACKHTSDFAIPTEAYNAAKTSTYSYDLENQSANATAIAHFGELQEFTITSSASDGTINPSGETTIKEGNSQTFTFSATDSQTLKALLVNGVSVDVAESGTSYSYTLKNIHSDKTVKAIFSPLLYWKTDGKWFGITKVFKKVNGTWVEQESSSLSSLFSVTENYIEGVNDES